MAHCQRGKTRHFGLTMLAMPCTETRLVLVHMGEGAVQHELHEFRHFAQVFVLHHDHGAYGGKMHHETAAVELFAQGEARFHTGGIQQQGRFGHTARSVGHEGAHEIEVARFSGIDGREEQEDEKAG